MANSLQMNHSMVRGIKESQSGQHIIVEVRYGPVTNLEKSRQKCAAACQYSSRLAIELYLSGKPKGALL